MNINELDDLESSGDWSQALRVLVSSFRKGLDVSPESWHRLGRLYQRMHMNGLSERAYHCCLLLDPRRPRTLSNLALLALDSFDTKTASACLDSGFSCSPLSIHETDLLNGAACKLHLFLNQPSEALIFAESQLARSPSVMALANKGLCLSQLQRFNDAVAVQQSAIRLHLTYESPGLCDLPFERLVGLSLPTIPSTVLLQRLLVNLGSYILSADFLDPSGLKLLEAGQYLNESYWLDSGLRRSLWDGCSCQKLVVWDDQGFGDAIQNLAWIGAASQLVDQLDIYLRPALHGMVRERFDLPVNASLLELSPDISPWDFGEAHCGLTYLPLVMGAWSSNYRSGGVPFLERSSFERSLPCRIGLVWQAGQHRSVEAQRSARIRDVPFNLLFEHALQWRSNHNAQLLSFQLAGHDQDDVLRALVSGQLDPALSSTDWLRTVEALERLDLLVCVDTSIAHLAGALGVPTLLLLSAPADWRWSQSGDRTFLYQSVRLVRCPKPGAWSLALTVADHQVESILSQRSFQ